MIKITHICRKQWLGLSLALSLLTGCTYGAAGQSLSPPSPGGDNTGWTAADGMDRGENQALPSAPPEYEVDPETFSLILKDGTDSIPASLPGKRRRVEHYEEQPDRISWDYPDDGISVSLSAEENYLNVTITSIAEEDNSFIWPAVAGETYYLPLGEGKRIPSGDGVWNQFLAGTAMSVTEQLSMPFWASVSGDHSVLFLMETPLRCDLIFTEGDRTAFSLRRDYPAIDPERENTFRIYLTDSRPETAAKIYRRFVKEQGRFVTLEQKAEQNPDIRKLYGAPHIYLWGERLIEPEDIRWPALRDSLDDPLWKWAAELSALTEVGSEAAEALSALRSQDYADRYQKEIICRALSEILKREDFYNAEVCSETDDVMTELLAGGAEALSGPDRIKLNKHALAAALPDVFAPAEKWASGSTTELIEDWRESGIQRAFIGLNNWEQACAKPELVDAAVASGYLIGPYDSYHSIHEPGKEQWNTAQFDGAGLYEDATIAGKDGEKISGFQNVGRKLNPSLTLPLVEKRTGEILSSLPFNAWFIDCDAAGELYDDYTPGRLSTKREDRDARLERLAFIRDQRHLVIGSEGGNDYAASSLAFAHGIELKSFSWMDPDMKSNRDSAYYMGRYYSPSGGVPERFAKPVPLKESYRRVFLDPRFDLPLYKLVYNDSVITTYHWDWSDFKIEGASGERMLRELLYNVPPLYHLDRAEWEKYRETILAHLRVWSPFHEKAVLLEMTGFDLLTEDGSVQQTRYGDDMTVTANFGGAPYLCGGREIPPVSLMLSSGEDTVIYTPAAAGLSQETGGPGD